METQNFISHIQELVANNKLKPALDELKNHYKYNPLVLISLALIERNLNYTHRKNIENILTNQEVNIEYAKIAKNILEINKGLVYKMNIKVNLLYVIITFFLVSVLYSIYFYIDTNKEQERFISHIENQADIKYNILDEIIELCDSILNTPKITQPTIKITNAVRKNAQKEKKRTQNLMSEVIAEIESGEIMNAHIILGNINNPEGNISKPIDYIIKDTTLPTEVMNLLKDISTKDHNLQPISGLRFNNKDRIFYNLKVGDTLIFNHSHYKGLEILKPKDTLTFDTIKYKGLEILKYLKPGDTIIFDTLLGGKSITIRKS